MWYYKLVFLIALLTFGCKQENLTADYVIKNVNIVDVEKGIIIANKNIAIAAETIT